jgi:hypothetical protein
MPKPIEPGTYPLLPKEYEVSGNFPNAVIAPNRHNVKPGHPHNRMARTVPTIAQVRFSFFSTGISIKILLSSFWFLLLVFPSASIQFLQY